MNKEIGKIKRVTFGQGGYQDAMIGVTFDLGSEGWGVGEFWGAWAIKRSEYCQWTEEDRLRQLGEMVMRLHQLLQDAKVQTIDQLVGKPVEVTFDGNTRESWRILTEAI